MLPTTRFQVLGPLAVCTSRGPADLGGPRQRSVLARLLLAQGEVVSADRLLDDIWNGSPPPRALGSLQAFISNLRRKLEPDRPARSPAQLLVSSGPGYALLAGTDAVDGSVFQRRVDDGSRLLAEGRPSAAIEHFDEALALWRGDAYADFADEPWAAPEATRLTELRLLAREHRLASSLAAGNAAGAAPELETLTAEYPLREGLWRLFALALYRTGRQADSLAALRAAKERLADELGIDASPALRQLETQVLAQAPQLDWRPPRELPDEAPETSLPTRTSAPQPAVTTAAVAAQATSAGRSSSQLVERGREIGLLTSALCEALDGRGQIALITGAPGIGKSALLTEVRRQAAESGATVCIARSSDLEQQFGFGVVRQLFEHLVHAESSDGSPLLADAAARAASIFDPAPSVNGDGEDAAFALLHALYWLTVRLSSRGPLVLLVDDVHWCDRESMRFIAYLSRRIEHLPVLLVATERSGMLYPALDMVRDIESDPATVVISPQLLTPAGTEDVVRGRMSADAHPDFVNACYEVSTGNPLLLRQLLRALETDGVTPDAAHAELVRAQGSRAVATMVLQRLRRLSPAARATARALAVLGDGAGLPAVAELAELSEWDVAASSDELARAEILRPTPRLAFVHALVRDAVYQEIGAGDRALLHDRAARVLDGAGAEPEAVAAQLLQAPPRGDPWAIGILRRSAEAASARGATEAVVVYLRRVLDEPCSAEERPDVLYELGRTETAHHGPDAMQHLEEAYDLLTDLPKKAFVAQLLARTMIFAAPPGTGSAFARRAVAGLPATMSDERQALLALERVGAHLNGLPVDRWGFWDEPNLQGEGPGAQMLRAASSWQRLCVAAPMREAVELAEHSLADQSLYGADNGLLWVVAKWSLEHADIDVLPYWENAIAHAREQGSLFAALAVHLWRGYTLLRHGDLALARDSLALALEGVRMWDAEMGSVYVDAHMVSVLVEQGDVAAARAILERQTFIQPGTDGHVLLLNAWADMLLAERRFDEALSVLNEAKGYLPHLINPAWRREPSNRARALIGLGLHAEAADILEEQLALARSWGAPSHVARMLRLLARTRDDGGPELLEEAASLVEDSIVRLERAKCLLELGKVRIRAGDTSGLRMLQEAQAMAGACGANRIRDRAGAEIHSIRTANA